MKKWNLLAAAIIGAAGLSACEVEIEDTKTTENTLKPTQFAAFKGVYTGRTGALSQGLSTYCDIDLDIEQSAKKLVLSQLEYNCDDGTTWGSDTPMVFELRKSKDRTQLAYDVYRNGTYAGFQNYSNNYILLTLSEVTGSITIAISQSKPGVRLEKYQVASNDWILFKPTAADLTKE